MAAPVEGLQEVDGVLLDGLSFCSKVYGIFDAVAAAPEGFGDLRLRRNARSKRLIEELLPLVQYIQARYGPGHRIRVRWLGGSQQYDARLLLSGRKVQYLKIPRVQHVEITGAVHPNDYLLREHLHTHGGGFGPHGTVRDPKTKRTVSSPVALSRTDALAEQVGFVRKRIDEKASKTYPPNTTLLVVLAGSSVLLEDEWDDILRDFSGERCPRKFREVVLAHPTSGRIDSLLAKRRGHHTA